MKAWNALSPAWQATITRNMRSVGLFLGTCLTLLYFDAGQNGQQDFSQFLVYVQHHWWGVVGAAIFVGGYQTSKTVAQARNGGVKG